MNIDYTLCYRERYANRWNCKHYIESLKMLDKKAKEVRSLGGVLTMAIPFYSITPMWLRMLILKYNYLKPDVYNV